MHPLAIQLLLPVQRYACEKERRNPSNSVRYQVGKKDDILMLIYDITQTLPHGPGRIDQPRLVIIVRGFHGLHRR